MNSKHRHLDPANQCKNGLVDFPST